MKLSNIIFVLFFLVGYTAVADVYLVPIRGQDISACLKVQSLVPQLGSCFMVSTNTKEFDNGNTFVQFQDDVRGKAVIVLVSESLTGNQLMEALIKIRTAKTMGAKSVEVLVENSIKTNVVNQLYEAGADLIVRSEASGHLIHLRDSSTEPRSALGKTQRKILVFSDTHPQLATEIAERIQVSKVTDYEALVAEVNRHKGNVQILYVESSTPRVNESLFQALDRIKSLTLQGARVDLVTPYFPYSRSDKVDQVGVAVTGRLVADLIEDAGVSTAIFARLHAPQVQGFFRIPTIHVSGRLTISDYLKTKNIDAVISPDAGFQKEVSIYADLLGKPVYVLNKFRDPLTGVSEMKKMGKFKLKGMTVAIIDDETASGGTLAEAAKFLKSKGAAKVIAVVTHLAGNASKAMVSEHLDEMVVTNTIPLRSAEASRLEVLSIADELSKDLKSLVSRISTCQSLLEVVN